MLTWWLTFGVGVVVGVSVTIMGGILVWVMND